MRKKIQHKKVVPPPSSTAEKATEDSITVPQQQHVGTLVAHTVRPGDGGRVVTKRTRDHKTPNPNMGLAHVHNDILGDTDDGGGGEGDPPLLHDEYLLLECEGYE